MSKIEQCCICDEPTWQAGGRGGSEGKPQTKEMTMRTSKWTPEPWEVAIGRRGRKGSCGIRDDRHRYIAQFGEVDDPVHGPGPHKTLANAKRAAACVNSLAGLADPADLRAQRDTLLASCRELRNALSFIRARNPDTVRCIESRPIILRADAAIAACEAQAVKAIEAALQAACKTLLLVDDKGVVESSAIQKKQDTLLLAMRGIVKLTYDFDDSMDTVDLEDLLADINDKANAAITACET